jgi:glyoxylase-like metal-dependent hydrolase (beta-lactamase superfamily II)
VSGRVLPLRGSTDPWSGGPVTASAQCVLAPNPSPWTLDGTNTWVLTAPGSESVVVIDPGPDDPAHLAAVRAQAERHGRVARVLLTHGHVDHAEGARTLAAACGVGVRALDPEHRLGDEGLADGDVVDLGAWTIEVVATPGHSGDSVCLVVPHDGSVLTGDTVLGRGTSLVAWPDGRLADYLDSLRRLREVVDSSGVVRLLPGHGPVLADPGGVLDAYLDHRRARLAEVQEVMASGITEPAAIVEVVYADVPRAVWPAAELTVRAQLDYLQQQ